MILVALGSNLAGPAGPPLAQVQAALDALAARGVAVLGRSRWWRSPAWPDPREPEFVNGVASLRSALPPAELLRVLHAVEAELGRIRGRRNAPRTIDLDLLDYDGRVVREPGGLELPHPRLGERGFVLHPLAELAPDWRHPVSGLTATALAATLAPEAGVEPLENTQR